MPWGGKFVPSAAVVADIFCAGCLFSTARNKPQLQRSNCSQAKGYGIPPEEYKIRTAQSTDLGGRLAMHRFASSGSLRLVVQGASDTIGCKPRRMPGWKNTRRHLPAEPRRRRDDLGLRLSLISPGLLGAAVPPPQLMSRMVGMMAASGHPLVSASRMEVKAEMQPTIQK